MPRRGRRGAGAGLRGRPEPAGPSITEGGWVGSKEIRSSGNGRYSLLKPEMSWFGQDYIPWLLWPVHSTSFTPWFVHFYTPCHVATRDLPLRSSAATLHIVGPNAGLAAVVRVRFVGRPSRPSGRPVRHRGPSRQHVGPVLLGSWRRSLSCRAQCGRSVLVVPPGPGPACQRLASPGGGVIGLGFVSPLIPIRLRVVLALPARRPFLGRFVAARPAAPGP